LTVLQTGVVPKQAPLQPAGTHCPEALHVSPPAHSPHELPQGSWPHSCEPQSHVTQAFATQCCPALQQTLSHAICGELQAGPASAGVLPPESLPPQPETATQKEKSPTRTMVFIDSVPPRRRTHMPP